MTGFGIHYIYGGLAVLIGSVALIKIFDFLAGQRIKKFLGTETSTQMKSGMCVSIPKGSN